MPANSDIMLCFHHSPAMRGERKEYPLLHPLRWSAVHRIATTISNEVSIYYWLSSTHDHNIFILTDCMLLHRRLLGQMPLNSQHARKVDVQRNFRPRQILQRLRILEEYKMGHEGEFLQVRGWQDRRQWSVERCRAKQCWILVTICDLSSKPGHDD